ncbi:nucleotidyl transferase AbiEii/AbiGii toxin family protein [Phenylobacterium sp.]|uniref:nucleotidyl transferase AbiEii/AbiGii toxin family protein n=1 Tax=Phenylobacterium sp. TaxID=1871053 RepID=UPI002C11F58B|nr:nucleotidyl transferase AbiEii/AbiGii toxin family protein [Phenylobacterium sp.]HVI33760.1 nucleotidyl transferase AbiEii/AbiGii toxin family protein [Phenylobacterium sp.]
MPPELLHRHPQFGDLIAIVADEMKIVPALVEKDYWIMHSLWGLQKGGHTFELKGGTSLSKGYGWIGRFSEDIDIRIEPPAALEVAVGRNQNKAAHVESRRRFYDHLAQTLKIDGVVAVTRDEAFDDPTYYRGAGIRLAYESAHGSVAGLKDGILLEVGFDDVTPNATIDISSWAWDYAAPRVELVDNRAKAVACYDPGHTLVEKLQAISTKFRAQQQDGVFRPNFMRHYYDVHCLLQQPQVRAFVGSKSYEAHKARRFRQADEKDLTKNEAFILSDPEVRRELADAYAASAALYYRGQPPFEELLATLEAWCAKL